MSRARKLVEGALKKLDEASARADAAAVAKLSPAERERYDYWQARTAALNADGSTADLEDAKLVGKVLHGPAGEVVHGVVKAPEQDFIEDPAAWEEQRTLERAARDEIRAQYLAPDRSPVRITRVATRGKTQLREVADYLGSSGLAGRPDLVYGAYRVPDLISPGSMGGEGRGIVEWDVVHAAERGAAARRDAGGAHARRQGRARGALARRAGAARRGPRAARARRRRHRAGADARDRARRLDRQAGQRVGEQRHEDRGSCGGRAPPRDPAGPATSARRWTCARVRRTAW